MGMRCSEQDGMRGTSIRGCQSCLCSHGHIHVLLPGAEASSCSFPSPCSIHREWRPPR